MISFKQYLAEKAMNQTEFAKTLSRQGDKAKVGFEFEMVIPRHSSLLANQQGDRDYVYLRNIDTMDEILEYFVVSKSDQRSIDRDFDRWRDDRKAEFISNWVDDNGLDEDEVEEHGEKNARAMAEERARDEYESNHEDEATFAEYLNSALPSVYQFLMDYGLEPKYGWESDSGNDSSRVYIEEYAGDGEEVQKQTFVNVENDLSNFLNTTVTTPWKGSDVHFKNGDWLVVPDNSITPGKDGGVGVEVVSPPLPLKEALKALETMFKWMKANHAQTNKSTGLHINISMPGLENADLVKLVLFMGEKHVLKQFDRLNNEFTESQIKNIINNLTGTGKLPKSAKAMIDIAKGAMSTHKYSTVNIGKLANGYLEFRVAGDLDYHHKYDLIKDTVLRFVSALEVAVDPEAYKKEYLKKLSRVLGFAESTDHNDDYEDRGLRDLLDIADMQPVMTILDSYVKDAKAGRDTSPAWRDRAYDWVEGPLMSGLFKAFSELGIKKLSDRQKAEFKLLAKRLGVDIERLRNEPADPWKRHVFDMLGLTK